MFLTKSHLFVRNGDVPVSPNIWEIKRLAAARYGDANRGSEPELKLSIKKVVEMFFPIGCRCSHGFVHWGRNHITTRVIGQRFMFADELFINTVKRVIS